VALLNDEPLSASTVPKLTRLLDAQVRAFHDAPLGKDWANLFLDGVRIKVRRSFGPQRLLLLVAYGVRPHGQRQLLGFVRARGDSQAGRDGPLQSFYPRGLRPRHLRLIITHGCDGLAAALHTVYPPVPHQSVI